MDGAHRVLIMGVPLRFFLREGQAAAWSPVTDVEFHDAYQESMFDPEALRKDVLCPNRKRVEYETAEGLFWSDGRAACGLITLNDGSPREHAGPRAIGDGGGAA
ncbi:hypothetical protein AAHZ94_15245 [Streptomyces sp. HSW2009]|uniref:hypothetical protein n=1 Tax=Streptomyces sp. HSW2009 TaxID=3142890 RepID=UPI0032EB46B3